MKAGVLILSLWLLLIHCQGQPATSTVQVGEFGSATANGLLYSPRTMGRLQRIVDSLNLRYKKCEIPRVYRGHWQGQACHIRLETGDLAAAVRLLQAGTAPEIFLAQFPKAAYAASLLVVVAEEKETHNERQLVRMAYRSIPLNDQGEFVIRLDAAFAPEKVHAGQWVMQHERQGYGGPYLEAFYFPAGLTQTALPKPYAMLVQYADCLVDTTAQIYLETAKRTGGRFPTKTASSQVAFMRYVHEQTRRPATDYNYKLSEAEQTARWQASSVWDSLRLPKVDALASNPRFRELLARAATDEANLGNTSDEFEQYVARYYSSARALHLKRSRRVVGNCSQDNGPRVHALGIAQLSAEAVNWETFLRAHLDIMNDRFERVSDGSYAWEKRQTYLRELEELDINVSDLMLGIILRIENPSQNHYFGSVYRVGRALAETKQPRHLEQRLLALVADPALDTYNRLLAYYLFLNYNQHLPDPAQQAQNLVDLNKSVKKLPPYLVARATVQPKK